MAYKTGTVYEYDGENYTLTELCHKFGIKYKSVWEKLKSGKDITTAIHECVYDPHTWGNTYGDVYNERFKGEYKGRKWKE